jgi:hypothetical protein
MEDLEAAERNLTGGPQQLLRALETGQARRPVVRVEAVAVRCVHDDADAEVREDRSEQLA